MKETNLKWAYMVAKSVYENRNFLRSVYLQEEYIETYANKMGWNQEMIAYSKQQLKKMEG